MPDRTRDAVVAALKKIHDPEIPINVYDLGLIYELAIEDGRARVVMTLTAPNCPVADQIVQQVQRAVRHAEGVDEAEVELTWEPAWSGEKMTEDGRMALEMMGIDWKDPKPTGPASTSLTFGRTNRPR